MSVEQENLESSLEQLEPTAVNLKEADTEIKNKIAYIGHALTDLENDPTVTALVERNSEALEKEESLVKDEIRGAEEKLKSLEDALSEIVETAESSEKALEALHKIGVETEEGDSILMSRKAWINEISQRMQAIAEILGCSIDNIESAGLNSSVEAAALKGAEQKTPTEKKELEKIVNNTKIAPHDTYECGGDFRKAAKYVSHVTGLKYAQAEPIAKSVVLFSGEFSSEIRSAQYNKDYESIYYDLAMNCEEYIKRAPKFGNSARLFRGVHVPKAVAEDFIRKIREGGLIDQRGLASWSTSVSTAENFARWECKPHESKVVFTIMGTKMGTSIRAISSHTHEDEVLISAEQRIIPIDYNVFNTGTGEQFINIIAIEYEKPQEEYGSV